MEKLKVRVMLVEDMLGTASGNPDLHREFIASKSADAATMEEEMEALPAEKLMEKSLTVFPRDTDGTPILFDYQVKGFLKEACGTLLEVMDGECRVGKTRLSKFTYKRLIDNFVFVKPRKIRLNCQVGPACVRPLRAETMRGERVALASSETVPAGTTFEFAVESLSGSLMPLLRECRSGDTMAAAVLGRDRNGPAKAEKSHVKGGKGNVWPGLASRRQGPGPICDGKAA